MHDTTHPSKTGPVPLAASITDHPEDPNPGANTSFFYLTGALCEDTGQYLGFLRWGFVVEGGKLKELNKPEGNDTPTPAFDSAVTLFKNHFNLK
jgi:hypothetical protein